MAAMFDAIKGRQGRHDPVQIVRDVIESYEALEKRITDEEHAQGRIKNDKQTARFVDSLRLMISEEDVVARFLQTNMDILSIEERCAAYSAVIGFLPKYVDSIIAIRLRNERQPLCLARLRE